MCSPMAMDVASVVWELFVTLKNLADTSNLGDAKVMDLLARRGRSSLTAKKVPKVAVPGAMPEWL